MKFTRRMNDQLMATVRVQYHVGRNLMVACLALHAVTEVFEDLPQNPSRSYIEKVVRDILWRDGNEKPYYWGDEVDDEDQSQAREWAENAVNGAFPELVQAQEPTP